jgi:hypothetical protein
MEHKKILSRQGRERILLVVPPCFDQSFSMLAWFDPLHCVNGQARGTSLMREPTGSIDISYVPDSQATFSVLHRGRVSASALLSLTAHNTYSSCSSSLFFFGYLLSVCSLSSTHTIVKFLYGKCSLCSVIFIILPALYLLPHSRTRQD